MSAAERLRELPDDALVPVRWVRELVKEVTAEEEPALADDRQATLDMWARIATENLCRGPEWETSTGAGRSETKV